MGMKGVDTMACSAGVFCPRTHHQGDRPRSAHRAEHGAQDPALGETSFSYEREVQPLHFWGVDGTTCGPAREVMARRSNLRAMRSAEMYVKWRHGKV